MAASGRPRKEQSAGGVVLRRIEGEVHALVIRDPYEKWGLPKGHLEAGEASPDAALREVSEETGLSALLLGPELGTIDWYFKLDGELVHKFCTFYLMESPEGEAVPERSEGISRVEWVPLVEAPERISYDNAREMVQEAVRRVTGGETEMPR